MLVLGSQGSLSDSQGRASRYELTTLRAVLPCTPLTLPYSAAGSSSGAAQKTVVTASGEEELVSVGNATQAYTQAETLNSVATDVILVSSPPAVDFWLRSTATSAGFGSVTSLVIANCNLTTLPAALSEMARLSLLDVSCNQLESLSALQNVQHLAKLFAHHNLLTKLPPTLPRLRTLDLANNFIRTIQITAGIFPLLRRLSLRENPLQQFSGVELLPELRRFDIEWTRMEFLPLEMRRMPALTTLRLHGSPVAASLPDTTEPRPLLAHLDTVEREAIAFPDIKVLLLGDEGVGKTAVARGLAHVAKHTSQFTDSDSAMCITECTYESDKFRMPPRLNLWDVVVRGNYAISLTTSFFITERTLYLIVFNLSNCA